MPANPLPLLAGLTKGARAAYPFIRAGVEAGRTGAEIIASLKEAGLGARRADVLAIIRHETEAALTMSDLSQYLREAVVPLHRVPEAITKIAAPFSYTVKLVYYDEVTGETITRNITAHSEELKSFAEVEDIAYTESGEYYADPGQTLVSANVVRVVRSGAAGTL